MGGDWLDSLPVSDLWDHKKLSSSWVALLPDLRKEIIWQCKVGLYSSSRRDLGLLNLSYICSQEPWMKMTVHMSEPSQGQGINLGKEILCQRVTYEWMLLWYLMDTWPLEDMVCFYELVWRQSLPINLYQVLLGKTWTQKIVAMVLEWRPLKFLD